MRKCHMINAPWIFNTLWFFVKGLMSAKTVAKVSLNGGAFMSEMEKDIDQQFIPSCIGGAYNVDGANQELFIFDTVYLCPGITSAEKESTRQRLLEQEVMEEAQRREVIELRQAAGGQPKSTPPSKTVTPVPSARNSGKM